jgi:hypothetical protein
MALSRELREALLTALGPVFWLVLLLPVLSVADEVHGAALLFVLTAVMTFFYLTVVRGLRIVRSSLATRKDNLPTPDKEYEGETYRQRFWSVTFDAFSGAESEVNPITEYTGRRPFPYLVYSFWGVFVSVGAFFGSALVLARLVDSGHLDSAADIPIPTEAIQAVPWSPVELLVALFPMFDGLSFENRVFVGGVMFLTGVFFLTAARNLTEVSDDIHRRVLRLLVDENPVTKNEFVNTLVLLAVYVFIFEIT